MNYKTNIKLNLLSYIFKPLRIIVKLLSFILITKSFRRRINRFTPNIVIQDKGLNNKIIVIYKDKQYINSYTKLKKIKVENKLLIKIDKNCNNNTIILHLPLRVGNLEINIGMNSDNMKSSNIKLEIFENTYINSNILFAVGDNQNLVIGKNNNIRNTKIDIIDDNTKCIIGNDCLFSINIDISTGDWHTIIEKDTTNIINKQKNPLIIGNHCWLGGNVKILKNAQISNNTIIGAYSVVSKKFIEENTILLTLYLKDFICQD